MPRRRPSHLNPPRYLSKSPPVPKPQRSEPGDEHGGSKGPDPTRYGDWEHKGICRDF